jgi:3-deoxy-D-manno-octulosonic-acid transferase
VGSEIVSFLSRKSLKDPEFRKGRLGIYENLPAAGKAVRIWFHAASVGEVSGAVPTLLALREKLPQAALFLSAGTPQGLQSARDKLPEDVAVFPFPLDFPKCVSRTVAAVHPDLFVAFETEFWPNFYRRLADGGIPALLLNGRVSESSRPFYKAFYPLFRTVFDRFTLMAMHSEEDAERAASIGVPREKLLVVGSSKYEGLAAKADPDRARFWKGLLGISGKFPVMVGGSLRGVECFQLMQVFEKLRAASPELVGIFVPRHLYNVSRMAKRLSEHHIGYDLLTDIESGRRERRAPVVLVDRMGALFEIYSVGDLIFCGGTIEPVGGHNILEPAAWGKAVFYGPHLKKVLHEHRILRSFGGSFKAVDAEDLLSQWEEWIANIGGLEERGVRARQALETLRGVVDRQVGLIVRVLDTRQPERY